jgi:1,4-alpha-glucan branching enzyme
MSAVNGDSHQSEGARVRAISTTRIPPGLRRAWGTGLITVALAVTVPPAGATEVTFRFRPPEGTRTATVAGSFNDWSTGAARLADPDRDGLWEATLDLPSGRHEYKFVVNGGDWHTDETAAEFAPDGFGGRNSVVVVGTEPLSVGEPASDAAVVAAGTEVIFRFHPPRQPPNAVSVAGTFNGWDAAAHPMTDADGDGVWELALRLAPGTYAYQFVLDGMLWVTDEFAMAHESDGFGGWDALLEVGDEPTTVGARTWRRRR